MAVGSIGDPAAAAAAAHKNPNAAYDPTPLNTNAIPGAQKYNTYTDPHGAAPNFNGDINVHTASLAAFGKWISDDLTGALTDLQTKLGTVSVEPGSFALADAIRTAVNGSGTGSSATVGLTNQFSTVIKDLIIGLDNINTGITKLVKMYANTEDLNQATASQVEGDMTNSFATATSQFNTLGTVTQSSGAGGTS
jgi:hypothetical protein